jgi:hypothetical protein
MFVRCLGDNDALRGHAQYMPVIENTSGAPRRKFTREFKLEVGVMKSSARRSAAASSPATEPTALGAWIRSIQATCRANQRAVLLPLGRGRKSLALDSRRIVGGSYDG